jgi:hypothetical protein
VAGPCEHGNEPSGSIKGEEFLDFLSDCQSLLHGIIFKAECVTTIHKCLLLLLCAYL